MSWNNVIPMIVLECQMTCSRREPDTGYVIHEPECRLGKEVEERKRREREESKEG